MRLPALLVAFLLILVGLSTADLLTSPALFPTKTRALHGDASEGVYLIQMSTDDNTAKMILAGMGFENVVNAGSLPNWFRAKLPNVASTAKKRSIEAVHQALTDSEDVIFWQRLVKEHRKVNMMPTDPLFGKQWYLKANPGDSQQPGVTAGADISMTEAWDFGYSGAGTHIQIVDTGLDVSDPEWAGRIEYDSCWGFGNNTNDPYPWDAVPHGSECASVAAGSVNGTCIAGISYGATLSMVNVDGFRSATNVEMLTVKARNITVSSNSWGRGFSTVSETLRIDSATIAAMKYMSTTLRNGKGAVVVFAAGNEAQTWHTCAKDEMLNSPWAMVVGAVASSGKRSYYSNDCRNLFVSAPSSGEPSDLYIAATGINECRLDFSGTSAATPMVSGVISMIVSVNPSFTSRDIYHIIAESSDKVDPTEASWVTNAAGYKHSSSYGFGKVNARRALEVAQSWTLVGPAYTHQSPTVSPRVTIPDNTGTSASSNIAVSLHPDAKIEHIAIHFNITHELPTQLEIALISPSGTVSQLVVPRFNTPAYEIWDSTGNTGGYVFSSPYWDYAGSSTLNRVDYSTYSGKYVTDTVCNFVIPQAATANRVFMLETVGTQRCDNLTAIINDVEAKGYVALLFLADVDYLDWSSSWKSTFPTFFVPLWQSNDMWADYISPPRSFRLASQPFTSSGPYYDSIVMGAWTFWNENPNGDWTLRVTDSYSNYTGHLNSWTLSMQYRSPVAPPAQAPESAPVAAPVLAAPVAAPGKQTVVVSDSTPGAPTGTAAASLGPKMIIFAISLIAWMFL